MAILSEPTASPMRHGPSKASSSIDIPMGCKEMVELLHRLISDKLRRAATSLSARELASLVEGVKTLIELDGTNNEAAAEERKRKDDRSNNEEPVSANLN